MNWKNQDNKLSGVISTGRGGKKVVLKCFCLKGTTDFPSPHISSVWMLCCCTQLEKEALRNDFITDLSFLISDWKLYCVTRFMANSIPCQRGSRSAVLERAPAVESRPCSAPRLLSPGTRLGSDHTHNTRELAWHACSNQPCCQVWPEGFSSIPQGPGPGRPWLRRSWPTRSHLIPHQLPKLQQLVLLLPVGQQKAKSGEERTAGLKQQWIKREGR